MQAFIFAGVVGFYTTFPFFWLVVLWRLMMIEVFIRGCRHSLGNHCLVLFVAGLVFVVHDD